MVTGASGGLGQAISRELHSRGADLVITARESDVLRRLGEQTGGEVVVADLGLRADVERLAERARGVDILVANAGIGTDLAIEVMAAGDVDTMLEINLRSPILLAAAFAQACLAEGRSGQVVFMGSLSGLATSPNSRMYNSTKFGLRGFSLALRQDLTGSGIGVTIVEPGFIRNAGMFARSDTKVPGAMRTKAPEDVAQAVVRAIEKNPAEIIVAPFEHRFSATVATMAPWFTEAVQRRLIARGIIGKH